MMSSNHLMRYIQTQSCPVSMLSHRAPCSPELLKDMCFICIINTDPVVMYRNNNPVTLSLRMNFYLRLIVDISTFSPPGFNAMYCIFQRIIKDIHYCFLQDFRFRFDKNRRIFLHFNLASSIFLLNNRLCHLTLHTLQQPLPILLLHLPHILIQENTHCPLQYRHRRTQLMRDNVYKFRLSPIDLLKISVSHFQSKLLTFNAK